MFSVMDSIAFIEFPVRIFLLSQNARIIFATSSEFGSAPAHNLTLANQFSIELTAIEREVDIKVHAVEGALGRVHPLEILFQILA